MSLEEQQDRALKGASERVAPRFGARLGSDTGFRWMYVVDVITLFGLMLLVTTVRFGFTWPDFSRTEYYLGFAIALVIHLTVSYFGGLYDRENNLGQVSRLPRIAGVTGLAVLLDAAVSLGADKFVMPRLNLAIFGILAALTMTFSRWLAQSVRTARFGRPRVLLVGTPDDIDRAEDHLMESDRDARIVGRRSDVADLAAAVQETDATDVLLLSGSPISDIYPSPLAELEDRRIGVYHRLTPSDTLLGVNKTRQIAGMPFISLRNHALPPSKAHFKRLLDLLYLFVASPIVIVVSLLVFAYAMIVAGRPIFFRQTRVGRRGQTFTMVKLRTMYLGAEDATGPVLADRNDDRVIPAMAWMRKMRFDEIPQIWNVIKGDMSLVGPRPERPELAEDFETLLPGYGRRHDIRPGITGLAQVQGSYHTDPGFKLGHDLQYLVNWSPILDLTIIVRTVGVVILRKI
ncbi:MAG: exopolysaccharide biosynthesis polyprenyl glycosylphosphotransferase [Actinomycetota bacterium]